MKRKRKQHMNKMKWYAAAAAILIVAVAVWFFFFSSNEAENHSQTKNGIQESMEFSNADLKEDKDGVPIWKLKFKHAVIEKDTNIAHLTGVEGYFYDGNTELHLKADTGIADQKKHIVHLEGTIDGKTSDGIILHAQNLTYDGNTDILSTDIPFTVQQGNKVLTADSFTADRVLQEIKARGNAKLTEEGDSQ